ncbi:MAG TPA: HlyD family efflux transporter periplasmic adaptor subunit [Thermoanaerobaculia bacterium]
MDIQRTDAAHRRNRRFYGAGVVVLAVVASTALGVSQLRPAAPELSRATLWTGRVTRGPMLREVRGTGVLTPLEIRWLASPASARVERIVAQPGTAVEANDVIVELTNPELVQSADEARLALAAAEAELASRMIELESDFLAQQANAASVIAHAREADRKLRIEEELARQGLNSGLALDLARTRAEELRTRQSIEERRVTMAGQSFHTRVAEVRARVDQLRSAAKLRAQQRDALSVRAGIRGIVQQVPVEIGQQLAPGATLAKIAQPERLKAELRVAETQARDIQAGQRVVIDTRNGTVRGTVLRVHPASHHGSVTVDIYLPSQLPKGARPDLTIDGVIELERLANVLHVARPLQVEEQSRVSLFRIDGDEATRVRVRTGRASASEIEVLDGLREGDEVVLSDVSSYAGAKRLRLK